MVNEGRGPFWEHFRMTCTEFLVSVLSGDVESEILDYVLPSAEHTFLPSGVSE
ncbi:Predicted protein (fragment) [Streptantibioticus cattleyicolor NRRL 8057 = DSM 46488]